MHKGDIVIADHPDSRSSRLIRSYGIVHEVSNTGNVIIEMADGSLIKRRISSIAVYIQPPSNWQELYRQQQVKFSRQRQSMMSRRPKKRPRHH